MSELRNVIVYGVDLALVKTGVARYDTRSPALGWQVWTITGRGDGPARLAHIRDELLPGIDTAAMHVPSGESDPVLVVLEGYSPDSRHQGHQLGEVGGVIRLALWERHIPYATVAPKQRAKYATGNGNAGKDLVSFEVGRRWPQQVKPANNNEVDALVLASMGLDHYGHPVVRLPQTHRAVLANVDWPDLPALKPAEVRP